MKNYANGPDIPMGLGMALAENIQSMQYFAALTEQQQRAVIDRTHQIQSKQEMQEYVRHLPDGYSS